MTASTPETVLPTSEPATLAGVKGWLTVDDNADDAALTPIVAAVCAVVRGLPVAQRDRGRVEWNPATTLGATMLAARLWRRRDSPEGVAVFATDGPVYVQRNDPDVAMLLQLGAWSTPAVG